MDVNRIVLRKKLNQYFEGAITKEELGSWANKSYYELLRGDFVVIDKLAIYNFLKTVSRFHIVPNDIKDEFPCSENDICDIRDILNGEKNITYTMSIKIPEKIYDIFSDNSNLDKTKLKILVYFRDCISEYLENGELSQDKMRDLIAYSEQKSHNLYTLMDILSSYIVSILSDGIDSEELHIDFRNKGICVGCRENERDIGLDLLQLFDCATGQKSFRICITYNNGKPDISFLL